MSSELVERWARALRGGWKTGPDVTPEDCAHRFDDVETDAEAEEICSEAAQVAIEEGATKISMAHLEAGRERVDGDPRERQDTDSTDLQLKLQQVERKLTSRMEAFSRWKDSVEERLASIDDDQEELQERVDELEARLEEVEQ